MALNFDTSKLSNIKIIRNFQNMKVTDLDPESTAALPRTIEVLQPDADGAKVAAIWNGDPELAVDDFVTCQRDSTNSVWYVTGASGGTSSDMSAYFLTDGSRDLTGTLTTLAGRVRNTTRVTTTYTILVTDDIIFADTDAGGFTATFPAGVEGQTFKVINCGSSGNILTLDGNGAETVRGALTQELSDAETLIITYNATEGWW